MSINTAAESNREAARQGDGKFGEQVHAEPNLAGGLTAPRPAALEGWPLDFPAPEISVKFTEEHALMTYVDVPGLGCIRVYTGDNGRGSWETEEFFADEFEGIDLDIIEEAENWAGGAHMEVVRKLEEELTQGFAAARIAAAAAGASKDLSDDELATLVNQGRMNAHRTREDYERATTAVIARNVLKDHPDADYIGLRIEGGDYGDTVSGAIVYDADGNQLGEYSADAQYFAEDDSYEGEGVVEHLPELTANPLSAHWGVLNKRDVDDDPEFTIDLKQAAAWKPRP